MSRPIFSKADTNNTYFYAAILLVVIISAIPFFINDWMKGLVLQDNLTLTAIATKLGVIILMATLIERVTEVIMGFNRKVLSNTQEIAALEEEKAFLTTELKNLFGQTVPGATLNSELSEDQKSLKDRIITRYEENSKNLQRAKKESYKARKEEKERREKPANIINITLAGIAALLNFTILDIFIKIPETNTGTNAASTGIEATSTGIEVASNIYINMFNSFNVFISAVVMAGGAAGIHILMKQIKDFTTNPY